MSERGGMVDLIDLTARLAGDPAHANHGREDVQAALDVYRLEARYTPLTAVVSYPGGVATWLTYAAAAGYWETDGVLYDATYAVLTPATADYTQGRWTMATAPAQPVRIVGWMHDPFQAAADLLEARAAQVSEGYDFKTGPDSYSRSQRHKQLLASAERIRAMSPRLKAEAKAAADWTMPEIEVDVLPY